jgi:hypothetical protein
MAPQLLALTHHQSIGAGGGAAIAQAQLSLSGRQGQQGRHRVGPAITVLQALAEQQQAAAFGIDRFVGPPMTFE